MYINFKEKINLHIFDDFGILLKGEESIILVHLKS